MQSDLNQRTIELLILASVFVNEEPTTEMTGPLYKLPFEIQETIDYLRRSAVTSIVIAETKSNPIDYHTNKLEKMINTYSPDLKKHYNNKARTFTDKLTSKKPSRQIGASTFHNDEVEIICNEIKRSNNIESVMFTVIEDSNVHLKHFIAAINDNPEIKEVYLVCCGKLLVSEIKEIAKNRCLKVDVRGQSESEVMDEIRKNSETPPEAKTTFFNNIDNWQVIDGFITVIGFATLALAFIIFEAASLNPLGIGLAVLGSGLIGAGLSHFFSPAKPSVSDSEICMNTCGFD